MALIEWNESLTLNIPAIDAQHKQLIEWIGLLEDAVARGDGCIVVTDLLLRLSRYVLEHFNAEEELMLLNKFPGYQLHCLEHYFFTKWLVETMVTNRHDEAVSIKTVNFMIDWIVVHIQGTDQYYGEFIRQKEQSV